MKRHQYTVIERASQTMKGTVEVAGLDEVAGIVAQVSNPTGELRTTLDFEEALDWVCGPGMNRVVDTISGRRAVVVGAVDTETGDLLCRVCLVKVKNGGGSRFSHLSPKELRKAVQSYGQTHCQCGRDLR